MNDPYAYIIGVVAKTTSDTQVLAYMLVQFLPRATRIKAKAGTTRAAGPQDGNIKPVARLMGRQPSSIRYMCGRVEDRRDDAAFDAKLTAIEGELAAVFGSR